MSVTVATKRVNAMVCTVCWYELRPTEYAPNAYNFGDCVRCGTYAFVYRVSWAEVKNTSSRLRPVSHYIVN